MTVSWGSKLIGSRQKIAEDRPLKVGERIALEGTFKSYGVGDLLDAKAVEQHYVDELKANPPEGIESKYVEVTVNLKGDIMGFYWEGATVIHGIVVHESPIAWGTIAKAILLIILAVAGCSWFWIAVVVWLVLSALTGGSGWIVILFMILLVLGLFLWKGKS